MKYYSLKNIMKTNATYYVIFGERSNGKTYAALEYGLKKYVETGKQIGIIRRWQTDFTGKNGASLFDNLVNNGVVTKLTNGEWSNIYYYGSRWYLSRIIDGKREISDTPIAYGFSISGGEHDKSIGYPNITTIIFDEFITRGVYLPDEFVLFCNVLSTIIRERTNITIFMLGNTVNRYCPYFEEMGLKHVRQMKQGDIDVYKYGERKLTVAVEYTLPNIKGKPSDFYFAFDNPKLSMITGGEWEIGLYPRCPIKYSPKDILFTYFIQFHEDMLQCEIISKEGREFTFIHPKTTPLKNTDNDLIYTTEFDARPNYIRNITKPYNNTTKKIASYYLKDKIFYSSNEVGEIVRNYLVWCGKNA
jgi:hypothetical protein